MTVWSLARWLYALGLGLCWGLAGCDAGEAPLNLGPALHLLEHKPQAGEGLDCDPQASDCGFGADQPLTFTFDRWLLPSTATRQSIRVGLAGTNYAVNWEPDYNLVTRTVSYRPSAGWDEGYTYDLRLYDDPSEPSAWGFQAYDGGHLDRTGIPEHILFRVGRRTGAVSAPITIASCRDALDAFAQAGCTAASCHRSTTECISGVCASQPRASLALDNPAGLADAVGRVARSTDRGAESGTALISPERFGIGMPVIERGEPAFSLLVYRMLLSRDAYRRDDGSFAVQPPANSELERARSWLGVMGPMPPVDAGWPNGTSPLALVTTIDAWIRGGATTTDCQ